MTDLEIKLKAIIVKTTGAEESEVGPGVSLINDLGADSLDMVEMIMETEKEFGISIPDDKVDGLMTFDSLVEYVKEKTGQE